MKKYLFLSLLMMLAHVQTVKAESTDVSTMDNLIYVMPLTASPGQQSADLCLAMKNSVDIRGFQMRIFLPEGVTAAKTGTGKYQYTLNAARLPEDHSQQAVFSEHESDEGTYILVTCNSQYDECFTTGDGQVMSFKVNIAEGMEPGGYPVIIREMKLSETDISKYYVTEYVEGTLTIEESDGRVHLSELSTDMPEPADNVNVTVERTIKAGQWSTICLPFPITEEQMSTAFGEEVEVQVADFTGYEPEEDEAGDIVGIQVRFSTVEEMAANHPYIIKVNKDVSEINVDNVDIAPEEEPTHATVKRTKKQWSEIIGTYVANTVIQEQMLFLNDNKFWYSTGKTKMKAFRAYFDFYDVLTSVEEASSKFAMAFDTTGIDGLPYNVIIEGAVYTVGGQYVGKDVDESQLPKGVYIRNGKKFVIK